jgi:hypothetical protein
LIFQTKEGVLQRIREVFTSKHNSVVTNVVMVGEPAPSPTRKSIGAVQKPKRRGVPSIRRQFVDETPNQATRTNASQILPYAVNQYSDVLPNRMHPSPLPGQLKIKAEQSTPQMNIESILSEGLSTFTTFTPKTNYIFKNKIKIKIKIKMKIKIKIIN